MYMLSRFLCLWTQPNNSLMNIQTKISHEKFIVNSLYGTNTKTTNFPTQSALNRIVVFLLLL
jgi:hypothetical protein